MVRRSAVQRSNRNHLLDGALAALLPFPCGSRADDDDDDDALLAPPVLVPFLSPLGLRLFLIVFPATSPPPALPLSSGTGGSLPDGNDDDDPEQPLGLMDRGTLQLPPQPPPPPPQDVIIIDDKATDGLLLRHTTAPPQGNLLR